MHSVYKTLIIVAIVLVLAIATAAAWFFSLHPTPTFASLPAVTRASDSHAGDPINIAFVGDEASIEKTFSAAHWLVPDPIAASSTERIIESSVANAPYPAAPVSNLYLFGRAQDLAFELPTNTVRNRHHVRLWKTSEIISGQPLWIGTASYDAGIELSGVNYLPTHHISPNVDAERGFATQSLSDTGLVQSVSTERNARPTAWSFNGGGDWYFDDGLVSVLMIK
ncbi:MAG: LssY C-terminal domain-containing protein [Minisyncoccia bacterium]